MNVTFQDIADIDGDYLKVRVTAAAYLNKSREPDDLPFASIRHVELLEPFRDLDVGHDVTELLTAETISELERAAIVAAGDEKARDSDTENQI